MKKNKLKIKIDELKALEYKNAFVVPTQSNEIEAVFHGGAYMHHGQLIKASTIKSIPTWTDISPEFLADPKVEKTYKGKSIYIGLITMMFGHLFTDTSIRLWYLLQNKEFDRLVFVDPFLDILRLDNNENKFFDLIKEVFQIPDSKIVIVREVSKFEKLVIPNKTLRSNFDIHQNYLDIFNAIKDFCIDRHKDQLSDWKENIYIANTDINRSSLICKNEKELIKQLEDLDYSILDPKKLDSSLQIAIISKASNIITLTGANLYNAVFAKDEANLISIGNIKFNGRNYGSMKAFLALKTLNYYHISYIGKTYTSDACTIDLENLKDQLSFVKKSIRYVKLSNFSKTDYYNALEKINSLQNEDYQYFEIGTNTGNSIKLAGGFCVGVDPRFEIDQDVASNKKTIRFYQIPSDDFFSDYSDEIYKTENLDFSFIDGLHHSDQVFKDIINTESISKNNSIISVHDIIPIDDKSAKRRRGPNLGAWTGDVWKAIYILMKERPDLKMIFLDCPPSGLLLIFNPNNKWSNSNPELYKEMLERADNLSDDKLIDYLSMIELVDTEYFIKTFTLEGGYEKILEKRPLELEEN